ncbi:MAG: hypothetical protein JWO08_3404 [Verrucomicrobiaceae bacterium]|nr:hypothetical protein [Verrucomicrobiaceae bacterium]
MRQFFTQQHQVPSAEGTNMVADKTCAFTTGKKGQLHLQMIMPVRAFTDDGLLFIGTQHRLHLAQVFGPADHPERVTAGQVDGFTLRPHEDFYSVEPVFVYEF